MPRRIVVLSGPIASGKSTLATTLANRYGFVHIKTRELIRLALGTEPEREALQNAGDALDRKTQGRWIADAIGKRVLDLPPDTSLIVDSVRIELQIHALRRAFGPQVSHIHLTAPSPELAKRYKKRTKRIKELAAYDDVRRNPTERDVDTLGKTADVVVDTKKSTPDQVVVRVAARLGMYGKGFEPLVDVLVGGQYGSEGKGQIAAYLAREYDVLMRVGGPNAGHTVFEEPEPFTFHQLPSGTRSNPEAQLILGPGTVISCERLLDEILQCGVSPERLSVDPQAVLIQAADVSAEKKLVAKIGSTGQGVGAATVRKIQRTSASPSVRLARDEPSLADYVRPTRDVLDDAFSSSSRVMLEGTQGTGLSLHHGRYPYVTSRDTTVSGCLAEAGIAPSRVRKTLMVCRTYPIRVQSPAFGDSGPMTNEITFTEIARRSGIKLSELRRTEKTSTTKRKRRVAEFDWTLFREAASLNSPSDIVLTFADYLSVDNRSARRFEQLDKDTILFIEEMERVASAPVSLIATRFNFRSIIDRRNW